MMRNPDSQKLLVDAILELSGKKRTSWDTPPATLWGEVVGETDGEFDFTLCTAENRFDTVAAMWEFVRDCVDTK